MTGAAAESVGARWVLLLPIKATTAGKSRLMVEASARTRLAMAMAQDSVAAARDADLVDDVIALVEDERDGEAIAARAGVQVHRVRSRGLNSALREGLALPEIGGRPVAIVPADLPSLQPGELDVALGLAAVHRVAAVPDHLGTGTTMLAGRSAAELDPQYGSGSFAAHRAAGAEPLWLPAASGLRRDVDRLADLANVTGRRTRSVLTALQHCLPIGLSVG